VNIATAVVIVITLILLMLAVRRIRRKKLLFSCGGDCSRCQGGCPHAKDKTE
jgi:hypothetical protein